MPTHFENIPLSHALKRTFKSNPALAIASFGLILGINAVTPLSVIWFIYALYRWFYRSKNNNTNMKQYRYLKHLLTLYSITEILFYFYQSYLIKKAQIKTKVPPFSLPQIEVFINRFFNVLMTNTINTPSKSIQLFFEKWAFNTSYDNIHIDNIINWVSFAFLGKNSSELTQNEFNKMKNIVLNIGNKYNVEFKDGYNNSVHFMKPFLYEIDIKRRPWIYYFVTDTMLSSLAHIILTIKMGYIYKKCGVLNYWIYCPQTDSQSMDRDPIIFFHGIGSGILMYIPFLIEMHSKYNDRIIIIINIKCISMRFPSLNCDEISDIKTTLFSVKLILKTAHIGHKQCVFIGHSFGTMIICWILNSNRFLIGKCICIDPICFKLYDADIAYNFAYRKPTNIALLFMWYFVCREFGIAHVIARHFWWFNSILMLGERKEEHNKYSNLKVFLSQNDCIINTKSVAQYLESYNIEYYIGETHVHGTFLLNKTSWNQVFKWISD